MQILRFLTAFILAALATGIALDAEATPRRPASNLTAEQIHAAVDEAQAIADRIEAEEKARKKAEKKRKAEKKARQAAK